ncbi:MAG TPA: hypothetical protein VHR42_10510, partial [Clostridia bacterium]|nr:hypothetical protein [Clostridia bacterium]
AGVPALGFDIGAIGGRIRKTGFGYLLPFGADERQILQKIGEVMDDRAGLLEIRDRLLGYQPKSIAEMGAEYAALYQKVILKEGKPPAAEVDNRMISQAIARAAEGTETMGIAYGARLEAMRERIAKMLPGFISKRILKGQYPFKQQLKRLAARLSGKNGTGKQK